MTGLGNSFACSADGEGPTDEEEAETEAEGVLLATPAMRMPPSAAEDCDDDPWSEGGGIVWVWQSELDAGR